MTAGLVALAVVAALAQSADECRLKAAFLSRFPQFVEWPPEALAARRTVDVCLLPRDPFGPVLDELLEGEMLEGRPLAVRRVRADDLDGCHLLFVSAAAPGRAAALRRVATAPVLTVSDAPGFLDDGGILQLVLAGNRVRFEVDADAADRAGLRLSPQLLRLATSVRRARP